MNKELKVVITAEDRASGPLKNLESNLKGTSTSFGSTTVATEGFSGAITRGAVVANLAVAGLTILAKALYDVGASALKSTAEFEQSRIAFDTMLGSADKGAKIMKDISDFAMKTPFELPELVEGSKRLLAYNIEAEKLIPTMKMLGDITAGVGREKMPQLILALGQVKASGKLTGSELRQFSEAGVPLLDALVKKANESGGALVKVGGASKQLTREANSLNKKLDDQQFKLEYMAKNGDKGEKAYKRLEEQIKFTKAQIQDIGPVSEGSFQKVQITADQMIDKISDGAVKFEEVELALQGMTGEGGKFFGLMEKQAQTFSGRMSNVNDQFGRLQRTLMGMDEAGNIKEGGLFDLLSKGAEMFMNFIIEKTPAIELAFQQIGGALTVLGQYIEGVATEFWSKYGEDIMYILNGLYTFIKMVVGAILWVWENDFLKIRSIVLQVLNYISTLFKSSLDVTVSVIKFAVAIITGDWGNAMKFMQEVSDKMKTYLNNLFAGIPGLIFNSLKLGYENLTKWLVDMFNSVTKWASEIRDKIKGAFDWNKKSSPSYNDLMSQTEKESKKKLNVILDNNYMNRFGTNNVQSTAPSSGSVNINFNGNMSVRSDRDITDIAQEVKRIINREDVLFSQGLY